MKEEIEKILDDLRPMIQEDGGDVELVKIDEKNGVVYVELQGACCGCPLSQVTLKAGIERAIKEKIQGIVAVEAL